VTGPWPGPSTTSGLVPGRPTTRRGRTPSIGDQGEPPARQPPGGSGAPPINRESPPGRECPSPPRFSGGAPARPRARPSSAAGEGGTSAWIHQGRSPTEVSLKARWTNRAGRGRHPASLTHASPARPVARKARTTPAPASATATNTRPAGNGTPARPGQLGGEAHVQAGGCKESPPASDHITSGASAM